MALIQIDVTNREKASLENTIALWVDMVEEAKASGRVADVASLSESLATMRERLKRWDNPAHFHCVAIDDSIMSREEFEADVAESYEHVSAVEDPNRVIPA